MRFLKKRQLVIVTHNPFASADGVALYVSPAGVDDQREIVYRHKRLIGLGSAVIASSFPALGDGPLGLDAHVAIADAGDPLTWNLPDAYLGSTFWANVRPHRHGLEWDYFGGQRVSTDDGEALPSLAGGRIVRTTKLDDGGVRIWFTYTRSTTGDDPVSFRIDADDGGDIDATGSTAFDAGTRDYWIDLSGLDDGVEYTLRLIAVSGETEVELDTTTFTADGTGPEGTDLTITEA